jgi:hypothetical protein
MTETTHRAIRLALASLLAVALISQLLIGMSRSDLTPVRFFSYFTVLSNTGAVVMLVMLAARPGRDESLGFATFRGAVTVYMSVTFLVYVTILYPQLADVAVPEPWIDWSIHVVGPLLIIVDYLVYRPPVHFPGRTVPIWVAFPTVYLVYSLVRGPIVGWYPYPFLDPESGDGYRGVALWCLVVLSVILGFGYLYYWWTNRGFPGAPVSSRDDGEEE